MRVKFGVQVLLTGALLQIVSGSRPPAWLPVLAIRSSRVAHQPRLASGIPFAMLVGSARRTR